MSTREIICHTLHCDVDVCDYALIDPEAETPLHFESTDQAIEYARGYGWTVTKDAVSYGSHIIKQFAVCGEKDSAHDIARHLAATASIGRCGSCKRVFDPTDHRFDGHAQHHETGYCRECIDNCHEASADHRCMICAPKESGR